MRPETVSRKGNRVPTVFQTRTKTTVFLIFPPLYRGKVEHGYVE